MSRTWWASGTWAATVPATHRTEGGSKRSSATSTTRRCTGRTRFAQFIGGGRGGGGKGNILVAVHGRNRIYRRPSHPLKPGTERVGLARWVFHIPSRHCLHHARIPVACSPSLAKGGLRSTGARAARDAFLFGIECANFRLSVAASGGFILCTGVATSRCSIENIVRA